MLVRVTIEVYLVPPEIKTNRNKSSDPPVTFSHSNKLKIAFDADLEEVEGFHNWQESGIAEE